MGPAGGPPPPGGRPGGPLMRDARFLTEEEKKNRPKITGPFIKRILSYLKPYKLQVALIVIFNLANAGVGLLPALITAKIVDDALYGANLNALIKYIIADVIVIIISAVFQFLQRYFNTVLSQNIIRDMKDQMYDHLTDMSQSFFTNERPGDVLTRMTADIDGIQMVLTDLLTSLINNIAVIIFTAITLISLSPLLGAVGIVLVPLMQIPSRQAAKKRWMLTKKEQQQRDVLNQQISETLGVSGSTLVKLYNREDKEKNTFHKTNKNVTDITIKEQAEGQSVTSMLMFFTNLAPVLIYLAGGLILLNNGSVTVGTIVAVVALVGRLYTPVSSLFNLQVNFIRSFALFERIFDYLDKTVEIKDSPDACPAEKVHGDIEFDHVSFSYRKGRPVLKDISFILPEGKSYALVGQSGAGKTTITNLIPRLFDVTDGSVKIGGIDVRNMRLEDLRRSIGIVTQDTYLFNGTIKENLLYANEDATDEDIINACKAASIHDYITSLPEGYNSLVGNRGLRLSGGEKQRLSLARVLLKNPEIVILDEATSSLDSIAEDSIQDAIEPILKDRTSLIIAHRLSTVLSADKILVIEDGRICEEGTHKELLKDINGVYKTLYNTQFKRALEMEI